MFVLHALLPGAVDEAELHRLKDEPRPGRLDPNPPGVLPEPPTALAPLLNILETLTDAPRDASGT